jgi:NADPH-dependent glutamate synthase beta subunit-like oxidoreductase
MPWTLPPSAHPLNWSEPGRTTLEIKTGGWRTRRPVYIEATAPCRAACPAGEPVAHWIERARRDDWAGAWRLIREENPFPAVTGRVCAHPCESSCNRTEYDGAVAINSLERFVGDWGLTHGPAFRPEPTRPERVAIVGGGPAGLACAHRLARFGYRVDLFEAQDRLGGLLRYGIPEYRLPRAVLDREIELALGPGIEVQVGRRLGADLTWVELAGHDAVFLATGAALPLDSGFRGARIPGVEQGVAFLHRLNAGGTLSSGQRLVVVGGGSTAMDVARSARRLAVPSVIVLALEAREDMPAQAEEVAQALAEGVEIRNGLGVMELVEDGGRVAGVVARAASLERAPDGAIRPRFKSEPPVVIPADGVLLAIGQRADLSVLAPGIRADRGLVIADADGVTSRARVFAGGDLASARRTVTHAIGAGTRAARRIHGVLSGTGPMRAPPAHAGAEARPDHVVGFAEITPARFPPRPRAERATRPTPRRVESFAEVVDGLEPSAARAEAGRCFTCGRCVGCDICFLACPDMAIARMDEGYRVSLEHCKGCGLCVAECPRGALEMASER